MRSIYSTADLHKELDYFRDRYNNGAFSFEIGKLKLYSILKENQAFVDEKAEKRAAHFIETIRRKGQIIEL